MTSQYDAIARDYQATKASPLRTHVEAFSFFQMLGDVQSLDVLDLACGEGFYSRLIREAGAATVVGVDLSAEMIRLAVQSAKYKTAYGEKSATLSVGVAAITDNTGDYSSMVKRADMALFVAKKNGRNCVKVRL